MMNERQIFEAALDINESEMRSAYLDTACGNNTALRTRVEALLSSHEGQSQFLNVPALEQMHYIEQQGNEQPGDRTTVLPGGALDQDDDTLRRCTTINYRIGIDLRVLYLRFCRDGRFIIVGIN